MMYKCCAASILFSPGWHDDTQMLCRRFLWYFLWWIVWAETQMGSVKSQCLPSLVLVFPLFFRDSCWGYHLNVKLGKALLGYRNSPGWGTRSFYKLEQNAVNTTAPNPIVTVLFSVPGSFAGLSSCWHVGQAFEHMQEILMRGFEEACAVSPVLPLMLCDPSLNGGGGCNIHCILHSPAPESVK